MTASAAIEPVYVAVGGGQLRAWRGGRGPDLLVLPGLSLGAAATAERLLHAVSGWSVTVLELPGLGGSRSAAAASLDEAAKHLATACRRLGLEVFALAALELASPLADRLVRDLGAQLLADCRVGRDRARAWKRRGFAPPDLTPRDDGAHLVALWAHLRAAHLVDPADVRLPAFSGEPLPTADELHSTLTAAALEPETFRLLWSLALAEVDEAVGAETVELAYLDDLAAHLGGRRPRETNVAIARNRPSPVTQGIWNDYVELPAGRLHVRRAGAKGRPMLLFPSAGGSAETFAPVIERLAATHRVVAVDYLGNGESDKPERDVTIEVLADDAKALADALEFESLDLWGSHTGALVAMEFAVRNPERVGRAVLEGPVFISPDFQADLLENYFPAMNPDAWGLHLLRFWNWRRDLFMYWPWYKVDYAAARGLGIPEAKDMHRFVMGLLQSGPHYSRAYRSAYIYKTSERIGQLKCPALVCAGPNDMLVDGLADAQRLGGKNVSVAVTPTTAWWPAQEAEEVEATIHAYEAFFAADSGGR
jgi:pimeloyl-ACP methyl ester carboxylesterase